MGSKGEMKMRSFKTHVCKQKTNFRLHEHLMATYFTSESVDLEYVLASQAEQ